MFSVYYKFSAQKQSFHALALTKTGYLSDTISDVETMKIGDDKYVVISFTDKPDAELKSKIQTRLDTFLMDVSKLEATSDLDMVYLQAKAKAEGTKYKTWFNRETFV